MYFLNNYSFITSIYCPRCLIQQNLSTVQIATLSFGRKVSVKVRPDYHLVFTLRCLANLYRTLLRYSIVEPIHAWRRENINQTSTPSHQQILRPIYTHFSVSNNRVLWCDLWGRGGKLRLNSLKMVNETFPPPPPPPPPPVSYTWQNLFYLFVYIYIKLHRGKRSMLYCVAKCRAAISDWI